MEVFVATKDYVKEREDMLSFSEGDKFRIASKADSKWWRAYAVKNGDYGYVPSDLLEVGRKTLVVSLEGGRVCVCVCVCVGKLCSIVCNLITLIHES